MPMQPYQSQELAPAGADRIHIPVSGPPPGSPPQPSLVAVFAQEAWKRKKLLFVWLAVTAVVTAAVVLKFAQPLYRAEGKFAYQPNYSRGPKPIYTPPNIQSAVQILKSSETLDPVRAKHLPNVSADEFSKNVRVEVSKQSEFIDVSYDHPDPKVAEAVASDLMQEGLKTFANVRVRTTKDTIVQVRQDLDKAKRRLEEAKREYYQAHSARGTVVDPQVQMVTVQTGIMDVNRQIRNAREQENRLKAQIKALETRRDAPSDPSDTALDETFFPALQAQMAKLQNELANQEKLDTARIGLENAQRKELEMRAGYAKGIVSRNEYLDVVKEIKTHEATLKRAEEMKAEYESVKKQYDELKKKVTSGKPQRRALIEELDKLKAELAAIPVTVEGLEAELRDKNKAQADLVALQNELGPKDEEIRLLRTRMQDFDAQLTDAADRTQDLNANDLRIHSAAAAGASPYSTNAPKLGLAIIGASALLFIGYIVLFALPRFVPGAHAGLAGAPVGALPRALVALVPYMQPAKANGSQANELTAAPVPAEATVAAAAQANGSRADGPIEPTGANEATEPATAEPVGEPPIRYRSRPTRPVEVVPQPPDADPAPVEVLAERIAEDWMDRGGIVLFTPTADELKVAPAMGDLGRIFTERGDRVLVFDARHDAENPSWAGPRAPEVARTVEGFLDGRADATTECFVPTNLNGVEYSRADLSTRVAGVMAAHRFRQLVEQMRERYSLVFLVGPPVTLDGSDPMLATLAEGMVLVTESSANPNEVHAYLDALSHQVPTRVYGTLAVPKA